MIDSFKDRFEPFYDGDILLTIRSPMDQKKKKKRNAFLSLYNARAIGGTKKEPKVARV